MLQKEAKACEPFVGHLDQVCEGALTSDVLASADELS